MSGDTASEIHPRVSYRFLSWGNRMVASVCKCAWLLGESGGIRENFKFRSSQLASDAIWDKLSKHFDDTCLHVRPSLVPRPRPAFRRTASDGKLGGGLGTRLCTSSNT